MSASHEDNVTGARMGAGLRHMLLQERQAAGDDFLSVASSISGLGRELGSQHAGEALKRGAQCSEVLLLARAGVLPEAFEIGETPPTVDNNILCRLLEGPIDVMRDQTGRRDDLIAPRADDVLFDG